MQSDINAIKDKQKAESDYFKKHGQYSSAKAGVEWNKNRKEKDKKEDEHIVLLFILNLLKEIACEIGYLQLYTFYGLNDAIGALTSVLKNLHELRMKENNASN